MLSEMTAMQLLEWHVYAELEPFEEERQDLRFASIVQTLANIHRDRKRKTQAYTLDEMSLKFGDAPRRPPARQDWRAMKMIAQQMVAAQGVSRGNKHR